MLQMHNYFNYLIYTFFFSVISFHYLLPSLRVLLVFPVSERHSSMCSLSDLLVERVCPYFCVNIITSDVNGIEDAAYVESSALTRQYRGRAGTPVKDLRASIQATETVLIYTVAAKTHSWVTLCPPGRTRCGRHPVLVIQTLSFASFFTVPQSLHMEFSLIRETHAFSRTKGQLGYIIGMPLV